MPADMIALFAGPGGACLGIRTATGRDPVGYELDRDACSTREAAGHITQQADLRTLPAPTSPATGLWASPPCPAFSAAGIGEGHDRGGP